MTLLDWLTTNTGEAVEPLTPESFQRQVEAIERLADRPREPMIYPVGDNFPLAMRLVQAGYHISCSARVRTLLGEHLPV